MALDVDFAKTTSSVMDDSYMSTDSNATMEVNYTDLVGSMLYLNASNGTLLTENDTDDVGEQQYDQQLRRTIYLVTVPVMLLFSAIAIVINLAICVSARLIRRPLNPTMCLSVSLAGADAYAAFFLGLGLVVNSLLPVAFGIELWNPCFAVVFEAFRLGGVISTMVHLLTLALNHYVGILRPLHYAGIITRGRVLITIVLLWILPILFFFMYFILVGAFRSDGCSYNFMTHSMFRKVVAILFVIPLICMFFTYSHIYFLIRQHQKNRSEFKQATSLKKSVKSIVTTLLILGTYICGWVPAVFSYVLICIDCTYSPADFQQKTKLFINVAVNMLIVLKCLVDPIIYAARMPDIKRALHLLRLMICCQEIPEITDAGRERYSTQATVGNDSMMQPNRFRSPLNVHQMSVMRQSHGRSGRRHRSAANDHMYMSHEVTEL